MEFKSQPCTDINQSRKLLELGLKKETADMAHYFSQSFAECWIIISLDNGEVAENNDLEIPAWSLHRLINLLPVEVTLNGYKFHLRKDVLSKIDDIDNVYDKVIGVIQRAIELDIFNKDYLEEKK